MTVHFNYHVQVAAYHSGHLEKVQAQLSTMCSLDIINMFVVTLSNLKMVHVSYLGQHVLTTATELP